MAHAENDPHAAIINSFILRIEFERASDAAGGNVWHCHVTHMPSRERHYLQSLDELVPLIEGYFERMGVAPPRWGWLHRLIWRLTRRGRRRGGEFRGFRAPSADAGSLHRSSSLKGGVLMKNEIKWNAAFKVTGGPEFTLPESILKVDAYDRIDIEVKPGDTDKLMRIQPGDDVHFLLIKRPPVDDKAEYKPDPTKLTYKLNNTGDAIPLESHHVLVGFGIGPLLRENPKCLSFTNGQANPVTITVLVGRSNKPVQAPAPKPPEDLCKKDDEKGGATDTRPTPPSGCHGS